MRKFKNQDKDPINLNMLKAFKAVSPPRKSKNEWLLMENRLIAELAGEKPSKEKVRTFSSILSFPLRPAFKNVFAIAASIIIVVTCFYLVDLKKKKAPRDLLLARLVQIQGNVKTTQIEKGEPTFSRKWKPVKSLESVYKNKIYRTGLNGNVSLQFDAGTGILLYENSLLAIAEANTKTISLVLEKGSLLAKVSKRKERQFFVVTTPNAVCEVVGTQFKVEVTRENYIPTTFLTVIKGSVNMFSKHDRNVHKTVNAGALAALKGDELKINASTRIKSLSHEAAALNLPVESEEDTQKDFGLLAVSSTPSGAYVFLNGKSVGQTPLTLERPARAYSMAVVSPGFAAWETSLNVSKDRIHETHATLDKIKYLRLLKSLIEPQPHIQEVPRAEKERAEEKGDTESMLLSGEYHDALETLQEGNYKSALVSFKYLNETPDVDNELAIHLLDKMAQCHRALNDYKGWVKTLEEIYVLSDKKVKKDNLLWEIASVKASRLAQYQDAEDDLKEYISVFPNGFWIQEANLKLAEIQYLLKKADAAAQTYREFIKKYPGNLAMDKAIYNLAYILGHDINDCKEAIKWYTVLVKEFPKSLYLEDAIFWRADCHSKVGSREKANEEYKYYLKYYPDGRWKDASIERLSDNGH